VVVKKPIVSSSAAFLLVAALLAAVQLWVPRPMLLAERFLSTAGWLEILALATYAAILAAKMADPVQQPRWRRRAWALFSIVFFLQLALGLAGLDDRFLQSGKLHFPIPAMIVAGPIYRGGPLFMVVLFLSTVLLVGPAWCSHICYLGAWDHAAARARRKPGRPLPRWRWVARLAILGATAAAAALARALGASPLVAGSLALGFGLGGVALMLTLSRRTGAMFHCLAYCPIGALAALAGRLSPFRVRIAAGCDGCMRCRTACRYDALGRDDVARRRPDPTSCTLCGDCLASCSGRFLEYRFLGLRADRARSLFITLVVVLHAASLGVARI
jgi:polyferredoxin